MTAYTVTVLLEAVDPSVSDEDAPEPWRETYGLTADNRQAAESRAYTLGHEQVQRAYPEAGSLVSIVRVEERP